jgi:hypothetical protein
MKKLIIICSVTLFLFSCTKDDMVRPQVGSAGTRPVFVTPVTPGGPIFTGDIINYYDSIGFLHNELMERFYNSMQTMDFCDKPSFAYAADTCIRAFFVKHGYEFQNPIAYFQEKLENNDMMYSDDLSPAANSLLANLDLFITESSASGLGNFQAQCDDLKEQATTSLNDSTEVVIILAAIGTAKHSASYWYGHAQSWNEYLTAAPCWMGDPLVQTHFNANAVIRHDATGALAGAIDGANGGPAGAFVGGLIGGGTKSVILGFSEGMRIERFSEWLN